MSFIKANITLLLGLSIPVVMIVAVGIMVYLPQLLVKPQTNFLYVQGDDFYNCQRYYIQDNKLVEHVNLSDTCSNYKPSLYVYDVTTKKSTSLSVETAKLLTLDDSATSPDGFTISSGGSRGDYFPFFWGSSYDYNARYLTGHGYSSKIDFESDSNYYSRQFNFLGWITP